MNVLSQVPIQYLRIFLSGENIFQLFQHDLCMAMISCSFYYHDPILQYGFKKCFLTVFKIRQKGKSIIRCGLGVRAGRAIFPWWPLKVLHCWIVRKCVNSHRTPHMTREAFWGVGKASYATKFQLEGRETLVFGYHPNSFLSNSWTLMPAEFQMDESDFMMSPVSQWVLGPVTISRGWN